MRVGLFFIIFFAVTLVDPHRALADDGGLGSADGGTRGDDASAVDDGSADDDAPSAPVIACDGGLCDTLQGRPSCAVAARSTGVETLDGGWMVGLAIALAGGVARRAKSGARRPTRGGPTC
ncbi:MAG: hypothetical protein ABSE49_02795 [Polyangiaceae bacterium]|jgi:hypothetical protein